MANVTLFVYCGLPGVGKSAASAYTARQVSAVRHRSDEVRKQLFSDPEYTTEETHATYEELFDRGRTDLEAGEDVVLDATFRTKRFRDRAVAVADSVGADTVFVRVTCDADVVKRRIEGRTNSISDADLRVYHHVKDAFEPLEREHIIIDNSDSLGETHQQIEQSLLNVVAERV